MTLFLIPITLMTVLSLPYALKSLAVLTSRLMPSSHFSLSWSLVLLHHPEQFSFSPLTLS
jgi:hypothetical protein